MMNNKIGGKKINIWAIILFIMLLPSFLPTYLWRFYPIAIICKIIRYITLICMLYLYTFGREKMSIVLKLILLFIFSMGISTVISSTGQIDMYISATISRVSTCLLLEWAIKKRTKTFFKSLLFMLEFWITINLFTIILFPEGLYVSGAYSLNYLLGYDNTHIRLQILALAISYIYSFLINRKITLRYIYLYSIVLLSNILVFSATAIIATILWGIAIGYISMKERKGRYKSLNICTAKNALILGLIGSIIIVGMSAQTTFSYIIENIFKKDMTLSGRTYIWSNSIEAIRNSFIWGYGYELADVISMKLVKQIGFGTSPHNFYLEVLYQGGVILLIITLTIYLIINKRLKGYMNISLISMIGVWLTIISIMGIVEPQLENNLIISWLIIYNVDSILKFNREIKLTWIKKKSTILKIRM